MDFQAEHRGDAEAQDTPADHGPEPAARGQRVRVTPDSWAVDGSGSFDEWAAHLRGDEDGVPSWAPEPDDDTEGATVAPTFEPLEGEHLEHLASRRRGPLRWAAGLVLSIQAQRLETVRPDTAVESDSGGLPGQTATGSLTRRRRRTPAELRRSALRGAGRRDLRPLETVTDLTGELLALVRDGLGAPISRCAPLAAAAGAGPALGLPARRRSADVTAARSADRRRPATGPRRPGTATPARTEPEMVAGPGGAGTATRAAAAPSPAGQAPVSPAEAVGPGAAGPDSGPAVRPGAGDAVRPDAGEAGAEAATILATAAAAGAATGPVSGPVTAPGRPAGLTRSGRPPRRADRSRVRRPTRRIIDPDGGAEAPIGPTDGRPAPARPGGPAAATVQAAATDPAVATVPAVPAGPACTEGPSAAERPAAAEAPAGGQRPSAERPATDRSSEAAAPAHLPVPLTADPAGVEVAAAEPPASPRPVAPISGWVGTEDDDHAWEAWLADPVATDQDSQLTALGADLARPLPAAVRLAQRFGRRRRDEDPPPIDG
jgi:hypothetical protein